MTKKKFKTFSTVFTITIRKFKKNSLRTKISILISFSLLFDEKLEAFNVGKKAKKHLKDMFVFAYNSDSLFLNIDDSYFDYFFVDPTNRLGNGPDAIYMISEKSKKLEEACCVAKDIVDLFRVFAEGAELLKAAGANRQVLGGQRFLRHLLRNPREHIFRRREQRLCVRSALPRKKVRGLSAPSLPGGFPARNAT